MWTLNCIFKFKIEQINDFDDVFGMLKETHQLLCTGHTHALIST